MASAPPTRSPTTSALCLSFCPPLGAKTANKGPSQLPGTLSLTLGAFLVDTRPPKSSP